MVTRAPHAEAAHLAVAVEPRPWTRAELERLPNDGNRYEVLDGLLLVTPQASRDHQRVATALVVLIGGYVDPLGTAYVLGPGAVPFETNELQPDVQVVPGPFRRGDWTDGPNPDLVIEVLSPSTRHRDLGVKVDAYLNRANVPTVWVVDFEKREVHVAERGRTPMIERIALEWRAPGAAESLRIGLVDFFRNVLGE